MPTRALFAAGVAVVEAREQVMFDTGYVAVFMATERKLYFLVVRVIDNLHFNQCSSCT